MQAVEVEANFQKQFDPFKNWCHILLIYGYVSKNLLNSKTSCHHKGWVLFTIWTCDSVLVNIIILILKKKNSTYLERFSHHTT